MLAYAGGTWESTFRLMADTGYGLQPIAGITYDQVTVKLKKMGSIFELKILPATGSWIDEGGGFYSILWSASDMDRVGSFIYTVDYPYQTDSFIDRFTVVPAPISYSLPATTCVVTGNVVDIGGNPLVSTDVVFRPPHVPSAPGGALVGSGIIRTMTDAFGNFSVKLLRGASVLVDIEKAGIHYIVTVPDLPSVGLVDLLPPIPAS